LEVDRGLLDGQRALVIGVSHVITNQLDRLFHI